jgi:colicin import membrane protein
MKENSRVPTSANRNLQGDGWLPLLFPLVISFLGHLAFFAVVFFIPDLGVEHRQPKSVINVSMVSVKKTDAKASQQPLAKEPPAPPKRVEAPENPPPAEQPKKSDKTVKSRPKPKPKTSLKKKTFKSTQVAKQAIKESEPKPKTEAKEPSSQESLQSALNRLKKQVGEAEKAKASAKKNGEAESSSGRRPGAFNEAGRKEAELIDLYRLEIAFQIQKNWAFNEQLAGGDQSLAAAIVFKVMPNGEIRDLFFTDRSGNSHLDESAYKAIMKSNPVDRHPQGLRQPYVVMAIRFTPQGIR